MPVMSLCVCVYMYCYFYGSMNFMDVRYTHITFKVFKK